MHVHRDEGVVDRFNRTVAERLLGYQYADEQTQKEWVKRLDVET